MRPILSIGRTTPVISVSMNAGSAATYGGLVQVQFPRHVLHADPASGIGKMFGKKDAIAVATFGIHRWIILLDVPAARARFGTGRYWRSPARNADPDGKVL